MSPSPPLAGIRVLELAQVLAAPLAATILGDYGAEVRKLEPPAGDLLRQTDTLLANGGSAYFASVNRNKTYETLDYSTPEGRAQLEREIAWADVVVLNGRPRSLARARLTYPDVRGINESIVYCVITGFGEDGPRADDPGMDVIAQAVGGSIGTTGPPGGPNCKPGAPLGDFAAAHGAVEGILAALYRRARTGEGSKVSINLLDATVAMLANYVPQVGVTHEDIPIRGTAHPQLVPYQAFADADGRLFVVGCLTQGFWRALCEAIARPEWIDDDRFRSNELRVRNRATLEPLLQETFSHRPRSEWIAALRDRGVPTCEVNTLLEALNDAQLQHNELLHVTDDTNPYGRYPIAGNPVKIDDRRLPLYASARDSTAYEPNDRRAAGAARLGTTLDPHDPVPPAWL